MDHDMNRPEYLKVMELKWALNRAIDFLNCKDQHLAACAVCDVTATLALTLRQRQNEHGERLAQLHEALERIWSTS